MTTARPLIAGNWKMNGLAASLDEARAIAAAVDRRAPAARVALCPPATLLHRMADLLAGSDIAIGGQDCHPEPAGAFTGCLSAEMLLDAGASLVILGHSERRAYFGESSALVAEKVLAALRVGLEPIVCVGETAAERESGRALDVVLRQLADSLPDEVGATAFAVAYEPIWAIGAGRTPSLAQIEEVHGAIRAAMIQRWGGGYPAPILYGGSVKPQNAAEILAAAEVGGALVGGASLTAAQFLTIVQAA